MRSTTTHFLIAFIAAALAFGGAGAVCAAPNQFAINVDANGNALHGYDTVAYFTQSKAVRGEAAFTHTWKGARWLFARAHHRDLFAADPERYAPRIGGFCALGAVNGRMAEVDPQQWLMIRGKLYLYLNENVRRIALEDVERSASEAEARWPQLEDKLKK